VTTPRAGTWPAPRLKSGPGSWSAVCGEQVEGLGAVVFGGAGAGADGVEAGVAEQVGDDNKAWDSHSYGEPPALI